jgi:hypothetical protein
MASADPKAILHEYLRDVREALLWKLDGLSEYDIRRPLTPTGNNLLGLVKHLSMVSPGTSEDLRPPVFGTPSVVGRRRAHQCGCMGHRARDTTGNRRTLRPWSGSCRRHISTT